ncbi:CBM_collapsed_G0024420.mRNA.1.CDS.1 [Saccharomyces cerevisiae]|nr:CBM_collapsed_G0024420.mRNA.1.CDS.1 [Saccharomyces cerevisiae]
MEERVTLTSATELRGLSNRKYQSVEDGLSVVETAQEVNVFFQDPERVKMMKFVKLAIVLQMDDEEEWPKI